MFERSSLQCSLKALKSFLSCDRPQEGLPLVDALVRRLSVHDTLGLSAVAACLSYSLNIDVSQDSNKERNGDFETPNINLSTGCPSHSLLAISTLHTHAVDAIALLCL